MAQSGSPGKFKLTYVLDNRPVEVDLDQPVVTLGRSPDCNVVFPDTVPGMSRHHATIAQDDRGWKIIDAGSRNGTFVNRAPVNRQYLKDGDMINLGPLPLTFKVVVPPPNAAKPDGEPRSDVIMFSGGEDASDLVEITKEEEEDAVPNVSLSIKLSDMSKTIGVAPPSPDSTLGSKLGNMREGVFDLEPEQIDPIDDPITAKPAPKSTPLEKSTSGRSWGIQLFSQIGNALLSSPDLNSMLGAILELVFSNVPAQRGLILMGKTCDELEPVAVKTPEKLAKSKVNISQSIARQAIEKIQFPAD